jgi:hypothetical protein
MVLMSRSLFCGTSYCVIAVLLRHVPATLNVTSLSLCSVLYNSTVGSFVLVSVIGACTIVSVTQIHDQHW